jgi:hypothetical protein
MMGVPLGHPDILMAKQFGYHVQVDIPLCQTGRKGIGRAIIEYPCGNAVRQVDI